MSIGARFAGVVFNRAQASDFARSISGISLRSIARHQTRRAGAQRRVPMATVNRDPAASGASARWRGRSLRRVKPQGR